MQLVILYSYNISVIDYKIYGFKWLLVSRIRIMQFLQTIL